MTVQVSGPSSRQSVSRCCFGQSIKEGNYFDNFKSDFVEEWIE